MRTAPAAHATPPETIEKRRLVSEATRPASTLPSAGVAATWANSIPESRPRSGSGVTVQRIVPRSTALTLSAKPEGGHYTFVDVQTDQTELKPVTVAVNREGVRLQISNSRR